MSSSAAAVRRRMFARWVLELVMPKSPFALVKEQFKDKAALLDAVKSLATDDLFIDRVNGDKGLPRISNKKLLHLHTVLSAVKKDHGSRAKLIAALAEIQGRAKDADFKTGLEKKSTPALYSAFTGAKKQKDAAERQAAKPKKTKAG